MTTTDHGAHVSMESRYFSYCQRTPGKHIQCLVKVSEELDHDAGQIIVPSGRTADGVYILRSGNARIVYVSRETAVPVQAVVGIMGPGDLFGLIPALDGGSYQAQLEAMTPTKTLYVRVPEFLAELEGHAEVGIALMRQLATYVRSVEGWLQRTL